MATTLPSLANYNINPAPTTGTGPYGMVPGAIGLPPSTYSQVGSVLPALPGLTSQAGQVVGSELAGRLPSGTIGAVQDAAAAFGVGTGMPGSGLQANFGARTLGMDALQLQQMGLQNYGGLLSGIGSTQLSPNLISDIAMQNAMLGAAPSPGAAANQLTKLAGGGTGGLSITGSPAALKPSPPTPGSPAAIINSQGYTVGAGTPNTVAPLSTSTGTGNPYQDDTWYGATGTAGAMPFGTESDQTGGFGGYDEDYYNYLVGGGLDPSFFMNTATDTGT